MTQTNPAQLAFLQWQVAEELARQKEIVDARMYYEGAQIATTTERIRALLGLTSGTDVRLKLNVIRTVINAVTERLSIKAITASVPTPQAGDDEMTSTAAEAARVWVDYVWDANRLDILQDEVHTDAINDGESFIIVDYREGFGVRLIPHPRYTDTLATSSSTADEDNTRATSAGDGFGCKVFYENDDPAQPVIRASKRWREELGQGKARMRLTEYYPDRIEKYDVSSGKPVEFRDEGDTSWPLPWVDKAGQPLGVPVFCFDEPAKRPHAIDAWGVQDAINQALIDLLAGNRSSAFPVFRLFGFNLTTDNKPPAADRSNWLSIEPGGIYGASGKSPSEAMFDRLEGADPAAFLSTLDKLQEKAAAVTDTPVSRFQISGQVASADTQKEYKDALIKKVEKRQRRFGRAWADALSMAMKLERRFGTNAGLPETVRFDVVWEPAARREIGELQQEASAKKASGVPEETIWREVWGYDEAQIEAMKAEDSYMQRQAMAQMALGAQNVNNG
jgi:hypothetical protein